MTVRVPIEVVSQRLGSERVQSKELETPDGFWHWGRGTGT